MPRLCAPQRHELQWAVGREVPRMDATKLRPIRPVPTTRLFRLRAHEEKVMRLGMMSDISQLAGRLAIGKEYIPNETRAEHMPGIIEKMQIAKEADILPADVEWRNYREELIVDLGNMLSEPLYSRAGSV
jgi:hypothetical protein